MNRTRDKGKKSFCGVSPVGQGLPERAGFKMKKGYRQEGLPLLVKTKRITAFFGNDNYWSSTENDASNAWNVNFNNGNANSNTKSNNNNRVRPVLAFT
ncbi:hypothetical protein [Phocaeicola sp.]